MGARERLVEYLFSESELYLFFSFVYLNSAWAHPLLRSLPNSPTDNCWSHWIIYPSEDDAMERQRFVVPVPDSVTPLIIYEETTDIWINVYMFSCNTWFKYFLRRTLLKPNGFDSKLSKRKFLSLSNFECYLLEFEHFKWEYWFPVGNGL